MLIVPPHLPYVLAWMLLHSLWQASAAAVIYLLARRLTQLATVRYAVGHVCLVALLIAQLVTFALATDFTNVISETVTRLMPAAEPGLTFSGRVAVREFPAAGRLMTWVATLEPSLPWITVAWLIGLIAQLVWLGITFATVQRELNKCIEVGEPLRSKCYALAGHLRLTSGVRFLETAMISVPATTGWLRPVVLIPAGWALRVPPKQVEAIILHELAHIARRDFLTGLLRSFLRAIYFFNLPLRWMIRSLDGDAEQAADQIAAGALGDSQAYAAALLDLELEPSAIRLLLGADGGSLKERFRHLLALKRNASSNAGRVAGTLAAGCAVLLMAGAAIASAASERSEREWLEARNLSQATLEIIARDAQNPEAEAIMDHLRGSATVQREDLDALARALSNGFSSSRFYAFANTVPPAEPLSKISFPIFGTTADRRLLVASMVKLAKESKGEERHRAARAAVVLVSLDLIDRTGVAAFGIFLDPEIRASLELDAPTLKRLDLALSLHRERAVQIGQFNLTRNDRKLTELEEKQLASLLEKMPAWERRARAGKTSAARMTLVPQPEQHH